MKIPLDVITAGKYNGWQENFFWPIKSLELLDIRKELEKVYYDQLNELKDELSLGILKVSFNFFVRENLSLINALLILKEFRKASVDMDVSSQNDWQAIFKYLLSDIKYLPPLYLPSVYKKNYKRKLVNIYKNIFIKFHLTGNSQNVVLFAPGELLNALGNDVHKSNYIVYEQADIKYNEKLVATKSVNDLSENICEKMFSFFKRTGIDIDRSLKAYLQYYHFEFIYRTMVFLSSAQNKRLLYDKKILANSGQNYFNRLLAVMAQRNNSTIVFHEHGESKALYNTSVHHYGEFGLADKFITYTDHCAELYRKMFERNKNLNNQTPIFEKSKLCAGNYYKQLVGKKKSVKIKVNEKKVLYVSGGFNNDANFLAYRPHDMVYFEWQQWLFRKIVDNGYTLFIKYHPGALLKFHHLKFNYGEIVPGSFEDYVDRSDILLFDNSCSTAFQIACCTAMPIVFINNLLNEMSLEVLNDLSSRVEIVNGYYDERNRFRINVNELLSSLEICDKNKTYDFVNKYIVQF